MDAVRSNAPFHKLRRLIDKLKIKKYRDSYVVSHTRQFLARQMRKMRGENSQAEFGEIIGKRQTVVSRLEDPNYGKWTLQTLFEVAAALNVAVLVRFVDFPTFLKYSENMTESDFSPSPFADQQMDKLFAPQTYSSASGQINVVVPFGWSLPVAAAEPTHEETYRQGGFRITTSGPVHPQ